MNQLELATLGFACVIFNLLGLFPYLRDVLKRKTKPERATWWVWFAVSAIGLIAQRNGGARWSLLLIASTTLCVGIIACLSVPYGYGRFHKRDMISLLIAAIGIVISVLVHSPLLAVITVVGVDLIGTWLTVIKAYVAPRTETLSVWILSAAASLCGLLAVGAYHPVKYLYPLYALIANSVIATVVVTRQRLRR